jgi:hypothetical protein
MLPSGGEEAKDGVKDDHFDVSGILETWKFRQERGRTVLAGDLILYPFAFILL